MSDAQASGIQSAPSSGSIALLFSGGLDTTLEVVERLKSHRDIYLLTFNNGCCINMGSAARRAEELSRMAEPDRIHHETIDTRGLMKDLLAMAKTWGDEARSPLVFDLACKAAGVAHLVLFARRNGVTEISDGAAVEQTQVFIQHPEFAAHMKPFVSSYGLTFIPPNGFDMTRAAKTQRLREEGFDPGLGVLEKLHITSQLAHQPFCMRGFVTFFFTSPLRHLRPIERRALSLEQACSLWDRMLPAVTAYIDKELNTSAGAGS